MRELEAYAMPGSAVAPASGGRGSCLRGALDVVVEAVTHAPAPAATSAASRTTTFVAGSTRTILRGLTQE